MNRGEKFFVDWILFAFLSGIFFGLLANSWEVFALMFTAVLIAWYSYETKLLREVTFGRPVISIIKNVTDTIEIRNDGSNIAYNIKIHFLYKGITSRDHIEIAILGKGLLYKIGISNKKINIGKNKAKLSDLINTSPPDKNLKVIIDYSDSIEEKRQFRDKWKLDETILMSSSNEGRFRLIYSTEE